MLFLHVAGCATMVSQSLHHTVIESTDEGKPRAYNVSPVTISDTSVDGKLKVCAERVLQHNNSNPTPQSLVLFISKSIKIFFTFYRIVCSHYIFSIRSLHF